MSAPRKAWQFLPLKVRIRQRLTTSLALEDKIVQMGATRILNAIFEPNFLDCSYGFREGRPERRNTMKSSRR